MKAQRHAAIVSLIRKHRVQSQEQLRDLLAAEQIQVTQATLSRDIRELGLAKLSDPSGGARYAMPADREVPAPLLEQLLPALLLSVNGVGPLLVAKTPAGSAEALGGALDAAQLEGVLGTIAGDDTLLIIAQSEEARETIAARLAALARA